MTIFCFLKLVLKTCLILVIEVCFLKYFFMKTYEKQEIILKCVVKPEMKLRLNLGNFKLIYFFRNLFNAFHLVSVSKQNFAESKLCNIWLCHPCLVVQYHTPETIFPDIKDTHVFLALLFYFHYFPILKLSLLIST